MRLKQNIADMDQREEDVLELEKQTIDKAQLEHGINFNNADQ